jgi:hypothetical protein
MTNWFSKFHLDPSMTIQIKSLMRKKISTFSTLFFNKYFKINITFQKMDEHLKDAPQD